MATIRARIELRGALTHEGRGRKCEQGKPFYSTNPSEIKYYQEQGGFSVTLLDSEAKPRPKPKRGKPAKPAKPEPEPEVSEDDEDDEPEDDEPEDDEPEDDEGEDGEKDGEATSSYTKSELSKQNKSALAEIGSEFSLELDPDKLSKGKMIAAILKAQIEAMEGEDDSEE